jgi:hypothetical protein
MDFCRCQQSCGYSKSMSVDIRRCSKADLDEMNRQIAIYKAGRNGNTVTKVLSETADLQKAPKLSKDDAEQLDLWGGGL